MEATTAFFWLCLLLHMYTPTAHNCSIDNKHKNGLAGVVVNQALQLQQQASQLHQLQQQVNQLQHQSEQLQNLQGKMETVENHLVWNAANLTALKNRRSRQVAFSVTYNQWRDLNVGTAGTLKYNRIVANIGKGYNPLTGHFTAPYSGTYAFFASLRSSNSHEWIQLGIYKGRTQLVIFTGEGKHDHWDRGSGFVTTHLKKGDQCYVRQNGGGTVLEAGHFTTFSGMLVATD